MRCKIVSIVNKSEIAWAGLMDVLWTKVTECPLKGFRALREKYGETFGISTFLVSKRNLTTSDPELMCKIYQNHRDFTRQDAYLPLSKTAVPFFDREDFSKQLRKDLVWHYARAFQLVQKYQNKKTALAADEKEKFEDAKDTCEDFYESAMYFLEEELIGVIEVKRKEEAFIEIKPLLIQAVGKSALSIFFGRQLMRESVALQDLSVTIEQTVEMANKSIDYFKSTEKLLPEFMSLKHRRLMADFRDYRGKLESVLGNLVQETLDEERVTGKSRSAMEALLEQMLGKNWKKKYESWKEIENEKRELVMDGVQGVIFASADTTASSMNLLVYAIIRFGYQDRLYEELKDINLKDMGYKDYEKVMSVCSKYINESMRLYPSVNLAFRKARRDVKLTHKGKVISLKKGDDVIHDIFGQHRDECRFKDAETFNPDRADADTAYCKSKGRQMNFADGIHACTGKYLAISESALGLALLIKNYRMELAKESWEIELDALATLTTKKPIQIQFRKR